MATARLLKEHGITLCTALSVALSATAVALHGADAIPDRPVAVGTAPGLTDEAAGRNAALVRDLLSLLVALPPDETPILGVASEGDGYRVTVRFGGDPVAVTAVSVHPGGQALIERPVFVEASPGALRTSFGPLSEAVCRGTIARLVPTTGVSVEKAVAGDGKPPVIGWSADPAETAHGCRDGAFLHVRAFVAP